MTLQRDGTPDPETAYDVPADAAVQECPTCGAPFPSVADCLLHRAHVHDASSMAAGLSADELERLEGALTDEETALHRFRLKALGGVVLLYFILLMIYALV
jgi:hypothetical protein